MEAIQGRNLVSRPPVWLVAVLFLAGLVFQLLVMERHVGFYDESLELYCAEHVLRGAVPYRDFWTMYGLAQFYLLAGFFKIFGVSAITGRLLDALVKSGDACVCFLLISRFAKRTISIVGFGFVMLWLACDGYRMYNFPVFPAFLCSLISVILISDYVERPAELYKIFLAGLMVGIASTFRHDSGFYICFAEIATFVTMTLRREGRDTTRGHVLAKLRRPLAIYLSGIAVVFLPVLMLLLWKVPLHDLSYDLFYVPGRIYPKVRNIPFQRLSTLVELLAPLRPAYKSGAEQWIVGLPILVLSTAAIAFRKKGLFLFETVSQRFTLLLLLLLGGLLFVKGLIRLTDNQEMQSIILSLCLLTVMASGLRRSKWWYAIPLSVCGLYLVSSSLPRIERAFEDFRKNVGALRHPESYGSFRQTCHPVAGLERARCLLVEPNDIAAIQYVEQQTKPTDLIFVGAGRHDKLFLNNVSLYFLSNRSSITKWYDLHPGVQTTRPIQSEIIASMKQYRPKLIVLDSSYDDVMEPNASRLSSGVHDLDDYIRDNFTQRAKFGNLTILGPN